MPQNLYKLSTNVNERCLAFCITLKVGLHQRFLNWGYAPDGWQKVYKRGVRDDKVSNAFVMSYI